MYSDYIRWDLSRFPAYGQRFQAHHTLQPRVHSGKSSVRASKLSQIRAAQTKRRGITVMRNTRRRLPLEFVKLITEVCVTHQGDQLFRNPTPPSPINAKHKRFSCMSARTEGRKGRRMRLLADSSRICRLYFLWSGEGQYEWRWPSIQFPSPPLQAVRVTLSWLSQCEGGTNSHFDYSAK